jgi:SAM-dependent methyltransferase
MTQVGADVSETYDDLAPLYDAWVESPGYRRWIVGLVELARVHGLAGPRVLDVGCGTGLSTTPMVELGLDVTGCDPSRAMLARAAARLGERAHFVCAALPALPTLGEFDLVTALNDVVNNVLDRLTDAVAAMAANLAPGGLLVMDATTLGAYRCFFATANCRERDDAFFAWRGLSSAMLAAGERAEGVLDAFALSERGYWRRVTARFVQRHHPHTELTAAIRAAGLEALAVLGQHDDGVRDPDVREDEHIKRIYVARKT